jgi:hypothetical protein
MFDVNNVYESADEVDAALQAVREFGQAHLSPAKYEKLCKMLVKMERELEHVAQGLMGSLYTGRQRTNNGAEQENSRVWRALCNARATTTRPLTQTLQHTERREYDYANRDVRLATSSRVQPGGRPSCLDEIEAIVTEKAFQWVEEQYSVFENYAVTNTPESDGFFVVSLKEAVRDKYIAQQKKSPTRVGPTYYRERLVTLVQDGMLCTPNTHAPAERR